MIPCVLGQLLTRLQGVALTQIGQNRIDSVLCDRADSGGRDTQTHPAVLALNPETLVLNVRQKPTLGLVVCVGDVVSHHWAFTRDLAYARHDEFLCVSTD